MTSRYVQPGPPQSSENSAGRRSWSPSPPDRVRHNAHPHADDRHHGQPGGHGWMMLICCIPMIVIAVLLFLTGVAGSGALLGALLCTAMMALMMVSMSGGHRHH